MSPCVAVLLAMALAWLYLLFRFRVRQKVTRVRREHDLLYGELLPCPFCGSSDIEEPTVDRGWLRCRQCDAEGPIGASPKGSRVLWNKRGGGP